MAVRWADVVALTLGGAAGTNARHFLGAWVAHRLGSAFPWATLTINVTGSFAIGFLAVAIGRWAPDPRVRLAVLTGFLGGYTTFSAMSLETLLLWERGSAWRAAAYPITSVVLGIAAAVLGASLARILPWGV